MKDFLVRKLQSREYDASEIIITNIPVDTCPQKYWWLRFLMRHVHEAVTF